MARNERNASANMNRNSINHAMLLNFQYPRPSQQQQQHVPNRQYQHRANTGQRNNRSEDPLARTKQYGTFYLNSSPNHAFILTRVPGRLGQTTVSNTGAPVSWESVRIVRCYSSVNDLQESCPICLEVFTCPRITKCGHCFCLGCLVHHFYCSDRPSDQSPKCPCCAIPIYLSDVRPVLVQSTASPTLHRTMRFVKLARLKDCPSPYLPRPDAPRRVSPCAIPSMNDVDAPYCRLNFVDPQFYQHHLRGNISELLNSATAKDGSHDGFSTMAFDMVRDELRKSAIEEPDERKKMEQFANPAAGMRQCQLIYNQAVSGDTNTGRRPLSFSNSAEGRPDHMDRPRRTRSRGDLVLSQDSHHITTKSDVSDITVNAKQTIGGSMFLEPDEHVFYQAEDGTLCFLNGFNMRCLQTQFSVCQPKDPKAIIAATPLPDFVEGRVLEIERVSLTQEMWRRYKFLSHLPVNSEICFVELSLGHLLSKKTKNEYQKEFNKRKQKRINKLNADKASTERKQVKEVARINELKFFFQKSIPEDGFFCAPDSEPPVFLTGEAFGPTLSSSTRVASQISAHYHPRPACSFSQIIQTKPGLRAHDFPALGSSVGKSQSTPTMAPVSQWAPSASKNGLGRK